MTRRIVARWQDWAGKGLEHLVLQEDSDEIVAESAIIGSIAVLAAGLLLTS